MFQTLVHFGRFCSFMAMVAIGVVGLQAQPNAPAGSGTVLVDGSSTLEPITSAVAEEFGGDVSVGISGTGGGFRRFCPGTGSPETDISDASRPIKASELERCQTDGVAFIELPVAFDGLTVAVSRNQRVWPSGIPVCLTAGELQLMWDLANEGAIVRWNQVRADLADLAITFTGAAETSGTRDAFLEFVGLDAHREDGFFTEDDQLLARQVSQDPVGITYFGFAFFLNNVGLVQAVAIDPSDKILSDSAQCNGVLPSFDTIAEGDYPFARPLFVYVNAQSAQRRAVADFVDFYLSDEILANSDFMADVGYVAFSQDTADAVRACWEARLTGSAFSGIAVTVDAAIAAKGCPV